jgi:hypothetical protein
MELQSDATVFFNIESYDNNDKENVIESNWEINIMVTTSNHYSSALVLQN